MKGQYQVELCDQVIKVTFEGMFDESTSRNVCREAEAIIQSFDGKAFYMMINLLNYQGSTPEAHKIGNDHAIWLESQNCLGKAIIATEQFLLNIVRNQQSQLGESSIPSSVFSSEADATTWFSTL